MRQQGETGDFVFPRVFTNIRGTEFPLAVDKDSSSDTKLHCELLITSRIHKVTNVEPKSKVELYDVCFIVACPTDSPRQTRT